MNLSTWFHDPRRARAHDDSGTVGAVVIAILFTLFALISFAVDHSLSLPSQPLQPPTLYAPR
jgi:hypothetical protein